MEDVMAADDWPERCGAPALATIHEQLEWVRLCLGEDERKEQLLIAAAQRLVRKAGALLGGRTG